MMNKDAIWEVFLCGLYLEAEEEKSKLILLSGWEGMIESFPKLVVQTTMIIDFKKTEKQFLISNDDNGNMNPITQQQQQQQIANLKLVSDN